MKTLPTAFKAHIRQGVTSLCTLMEIRRRDGRSFRFTDHDEPVVFNAATYVPYSSFARTSITTGVDLEVDQMEVRGILNSKYVARDDVAAGLFDFAEVRVLVVNWQSPDDGSATLRVGWLGEVTMNEDSTFTAELRGLSQVYTYRIGESYSPECRADLGDNRCKVAIAPQRWRPGSTFRRGEVVLGVTAPATGYFNLTLANASFDQDAASLPNLIRDVPGWTTYGPAKGRWTLHQSLFFGLAGKDSYAAFATDDGIDGDITNHPHTVPDIGMFQTLDLEAQGADLYALDTGLSRLYSTLWYACVNGREAGTRYRIYALDVDQQQIGASAIWDTGLRQTSEDRWFQEIVKDVLIPAGTRFLKFDLFAHKRSNYTEGAAFDTITAAINYPEGTLGNNAQFGAIAFQATTDGVTDVTEPTWSTLLGSTTTDGTVVWKAITRFAFETTVAGAADQGRSVTPVGIIQADGYFDGGLLTWETGKNAGRPMEIKAWTGGVLRLFARPFYLPQPGDRFVLHPGCDKTRATCKDKFANLLNMRAEPDVPGQDKYYASPNAPSQ
jgi:hypothetical protein